jgi:hypothetical protein
VGKIGRITTAGVITEYPTPTVYSVPEGITAGPDGALWFTESEGPNIGRITTTGVITEYPVTGEPVGITAGPDGALWFTEWFGAAIGRITTAGVITEHPTPTAYSMLAGITAGPDGALWFTDNNLSDVGEVVFLTAGLSVSPASGVYESSLTFTGTAFAPYENVQIYTYGVGSGVLASATADGSGSFTTPARAPRSPYGPRLFLGMGQSSGNLGAANFSMNPRLMLDPNAGAAGSTTTATGLGFGSFQTVKVYWSTPKTLLGTATANADGTFSGSAALTFAVPEGAPLGPNKVYGVGESIGGKAIGAGSFTVQ